MRSTSGQFLMRPRPIEGESLSSWRQRAGWANGYRLFPMLDERTRRADPDVGLYEGERVWLEQSHGLESGALDEHSLVGKVGKLFVGVHSRSHPAWWLRSRYGHDALPYGPMFCGSCLAEDEVPHFRLEWRYAFVVHCERHACLLLDQCAKCGVAPWPSGCGLSGRISMDFVDFTRCWNCGTELLYQAGLPVEATMGNIDQSVCIGGARVEHLAAARVICQLYLRTRSRGAIEASGSRWARVSSGLSPSAREAKAVEYLSVEDRAALVPLAFEVLSNWPTSFLDFASESELSREHFSDARQMQPPWMTEVIDRTLAKQNRFITASRVAEVITELSSADGSFPTKAAVRNVLGCSGGKHVDEATRPAHRSDSR